jgi:hypothetical protein
MYPFFGPPGPLTPHIDAPQLGFGLEKPFLTPRESDMKMTRTGAKYTMDRFRAKQMNMLIPSGQATLPPPEAQLTRQYFPTSYAIPCSDEGQAVHTVLPSTDASIQPQCATCLRLLKGHPGIALNNQFPNGTISEVAVNTDPRAAQAASLALNKCGVQCGVPRNYETTSVSCWPPAVVNALSL